MFDPKDFPFSVEKMTEKMTEMFRMADMSKGFDWSRMSYGTTGTGAGMAPELVEAQARNMSALSEAGKAAATAYQELFTRQAALFQTMMDEGTRELASLDATSLDAKATQARAELARATFDRAVAHMTEMAEEARKANERAYDIVNVRMQESLRELQEMARKLGA